MTRHPLALALVALLIAAPATAEPLPRYLIALWDGAERGGPGLWFSVDGAVLPDGVRLRPVHRLPVGTRIDAEAGRLVLSPALARRFGLEPGVPRLVEIVAEAATEASPTREGAPTTLAERVSAPGPTDLALIERRARIGALLDALREEAGAQARADRPTPRAEDRP